MKKKSILVFVLVLVLLFGITACNTSAPKANVPDSTGGESAPAAESSSDYKGRIVFINFINAHPYFTHAKALALETGKELGYEIIYDGPPDVDTPKFVSMIEDYTAQGVDALIICALDDSSNPAMQAAMDKGIKVVMWDSMVDESAYDVNTGLGDYVPFTGAGMVESLVMNIGDTGSYVFIDAEPSQVQCTRRAEFILDTYMPQHYPNLKFLGRETGFEDPQKCYAAAQNLLTTFPDVDGILCNTSSATTVAGSAVVEFGLVGKVLVAGENFSDLAPPCFENGTSKAFYTWDTAQWASFAVKVAAKLIEGVDIPEGTNIGIEGFPNASRQGKDIDYNGDHIFLTPENIQEFL